MKTYEFGDKEKPVIILLPGTSCHWKNSFQEVVPLLEKQFYVVCVSYDGFDENEASVFPTMLEETEKIEAYILKQFHGRVHCAYGCSLGGSFVGLLIQRQRVHIEHGILGSSDLDQSSERQAKKSCKLMVPLLYALLQEKTLSKLVNRCIKTFAKTPYVKKIPDMLGIGSHDAGIVSMTFVTRESVYNQFYSDLVTPLDVHISIPNTTVHCFYAEKMGETYLERYRQHFENPQIHSFALQHEELLVCYPEKWAQEVEMCCFER